MALKLSPVGTATILEWKQQATRIYTDLVELAHVDDLYERMRAVLLLRKDDIDNWIIPNWLSTTYVATITIGIRRAVDKRKDSVSLLRLLHAMSGKSSELSFATILQTTSITRDQCSPHMTLKSRRC
jgi:hypothetical protein